MGKFVNRNQTTVHKIPLVNFIGFKLLEIIANLHSRNLMKSLLSHIIPIKLYNEIKILSISMI